MSELRLGALVTPSSARSAISLLFVVLASTVPLTDRAGWAQLSSLTIESPLELRPPFDPERRRYWVRASSELEATLVLTVAAGEGQIVRVDRQVVESEVVITELTEPRSVLIDTTTVEGSQREIYELQWLPHTFAEYELLEIDEERVAQGFLYLEPQGAPLMVTDDRGFPFVHLSAADVARNFQYHPSGEITFAERGEANEFSRRTHEIVLLNGQFREIDRRSTVGLNHTEWHAFRSLPQDRHLFLAYHGTVRELGDGPVLVEDSVIQEVDSETQELLFEWSSWEQLEPLEPLEDDSEWAHVNSIDVDEAGNLLVSASQLSQLVQVDRQSGEVVWKLGGVDGDFTIDDPQIQFCGQHHVRWLSPTRILLFDNARTCPPGVVTTERSRAVEYEVDVEAKTAAVVWSYEQDGLFAENRGSAQRLANGNTLIGWGKGPIVTATEVTPAGEKVLEFVLRLDGLPSTNYRIERFNEQVFWDGFETSDVHRWDVVAGLP